MPQGEAYIRKAVRFSLSSPFRYSGKKTEAEIIEMYKCASDFGLKLLISDKSFLEVLESQEGMDDEQDKLIIIDYLVIDYVRSKYDMSSNTFKAAISTYDLLEKKELQDEIEKIVRAFLNPKK